MDTLMSKDQMPNAKETQTAVKSVITIQPGNRVKGASLCIYDASPGSLTPEPVQLAERVWTFNSIISNLVRIKIWKKTHGRFRTSFEC
jgi:hypothetical protein